jgi:hypothetical protein
MTWAPSSPVTGAPETGLTSPTYTLATDVAPDTNGVARAVTTLGGTQTGVEVSSPSNPFTLLATRPKVLKTLPALQANGQLGKVPVNTWYVSVRKGVDVLAGQPKQVMLARLQIDVPAGADVADPESVRAGMSLITGALWATSSGLGDAIITGVI